ncbi:MAG: phosphatase PAP2 family protein [Clostridia bacterium]|nr:phosphatase PAP2 family protein [Clostridia bacterium]
MKRKNLLRAGIGLMLLFVLWTILIQCVDVQAVGPKGTKVGFATWNVRFHNLTSTNMTLYTITDWLGLVPILICGCFGILGLSQWIRRKRLFRVDSDLLLLGVYYLLVIAGYLLFEMIPINYRPILIDGYLEASYPSSTTLLVLSVMPTLKFQADRRCQREAFRRLAAWFSVLFSAFMVIGRLVSGVHWATDIIGSVLLSAGLFLLYRAAATYADRKKNEALL